MPPSLLSLQLCCTFLDKAFITTTATAQTTPNTPFTQSPGTKDPSIKVVGMVVLVRIFVSFFDECISLSLAYNLPKIRILLNFAHRCYLQHLAQWDSNICCSNKLMNELDPVDRPKKWFQDFSCLSVLTWRWSYWCAQLPSVLSRASSPPLIQTVRS